jgi:hypothetical protein
LLAAVFELFELLRGAVGGLTDADKILAEDRRL